MKRGGGWGLRGRDKLVSASVETLDDDLFLVLPTAVNLVAEWIIIHRTGH